MDWSQYLPDGSLNWWQIVLALLTVLVGWLLAHFARRGTAALIRRVPNATQAMELFGARLVYYLILLLGIGIGFAVLGANVQPLLGVVIIVAVVAVLVLRGVADNFAAGVLIQTRRTVTPGEQIQIEGPDGQVTGDVVELNSRSVVLQTLDGRIVHVPNSRLLSEPFVNNTRHGRRRSEVHVRVERGTPDVTEVLALIEEDAAVDGIHPDDVRVLVTAVSPTRVTARVQFWHVPAAGVSLTAEVVRRLSAGLEAKGLTAVVTSNPGGAPLVPPDTL